MGGASIKEGGRPSSMEQHLVDPLSYAGDVDKSILEEIARLDGLRTSIRADQANYLNQHPEVVSLLNDFIRAVVEQKPSNIFEFARKHFASISNGVDTVVVAGPSGAGKGTIIRKLMEKLPQQFGFGCSHTTRDPREGEEEGVHYHFTSLESMREGITRGDFIEHAEVHGNLYGTSVSAVGDVVRKGQVCLLDIDIQGVKAVKASSLRSKYVFIAPPSMEVLEARLTHRGTESSESLVTRLHHASDEMEYGNTEGNFDLVIKNDQLDRAVDELVKKLTEWFPNIIEGGEMHRAVGGDMAG